MERFRYSKSMGQNFLIDPNIPAKIVKRSGIDRSCSVLEIGPGAGVLTKELCAVAGHVTAVELDKRLVPVLKNILEDFTNVKIIQGDILKLDIKDLMYDTPSDLSYHVCANLPYNITTPVLTVLIEAKIFQSIVVMVQKEVALRICAKPGTPEYSAFTVYTNYFAKPEILFDVPPECFKPRPKVTSSVVRMVTQAGRLQDPKNETAFFRVVRAAFNQRRKTLVNALSTAFNETHSKEEITGIVSKCGLDPRVRGEVLSIDEFIKLTSLL